MPVLNYKIACFASSTESSCCTSDTYHAQCYDPYCSDCVVDAGSSTGYGGVFPRSCTSGANCLGCVSGGTTCPGECKCHPGSGCGCYTPGTYNPIACTGGTTSCVATACYCCSGGNLVPRATNLQATGSYYILSNQIHWTQISWSYVKATCNAGVQAHVGLIKNDLIEHLAYYTYNTSGTWTGDVVLGSVNDNYYITLSAKEDGQSTECFEQLVYHIYSPPI